MAPAAAPKEVSEPFPISCVAGRHLLFDVDIISHVRRNHNICGVLVGTIPNLSQQNVFLGIPLELMPEEARVLVEGGHAYIVDDVETHRQGFQEMSRTDRLKFLAEMDRQGVEAANESLAAQERKKDVALKKKGLRKEAETEAAPAVADSTATDDSISTAPSLADSTASDATVHVELPSTVGSGLGFTMKGSGFLEQASSVATSAASSVPSESSSTVDSDLGSSFIDLGSIMKGSSFLNSSPVTAESANVAEATQLGSDAIPSSPHTCDIGSSFSDLGSIMKGSSFLDSASTEMKVERLELEEATPLLVKDDEAAIVEIKAEEAQLEEAMLNEFEGQTAEGPQDVASSTSETKSEPAEDPQGWTLLLLRPPSSTPSQPHQCLLSRAPHPRVSSPNASTLPPLHLRLRYRPHRRIIRVPSQWSPRATHSSASCIPVATFSCPGCVLVATTLSILAILCDTTAISSPQA